MKSESSTAFVLIHVSGSGQKAVRVRSYPFASTNASIHSKSFNVEVLTSKVSYNMVEVEVLQLLL